VLLAHLDDPVSENELPTGKKHLLGCCAFPLLLVLLPSIEIDTSWWIRRLSPPPFLKPSTAPPDGFYNSFCPTNPFFLPLYDGRSARFTAGLISGRRTNLPIHGTGGIRYSCICAGREGNNGSWLVVSILPIS